MGVKQSLRMVVKRGANAVPRLATVADYLRFRATHPLRGWVARHKQGGLLNREIAQRGFAVVPNYLSPDECARCIEDTERILSGTVMGRSYHVHTDSDLRVFGAEDLSPNINRFSRDASLQAISNHYNGVRTGSLGSGEGWHKDDSFRAFKAILYLNDVDERCGPFQIFERSHKLEHYVQDMATAQLKFRHLRISDAQIGRILAREPGRLRTLTGAAGTLILADTASIHRGSPPVAGVRYALTNYYVERWQIHRAMVNAAKPVSPEKVLRLRDNWTDE
jgi:hypothetical protein